MGERDRRSAREQTVYLSTMLPCWMDTKVRFLELALSLPACGPALAKRPVASMGLMVVVRSQAKKSLQVGAEDCRSPHDVGVAGREGRLIKLDEFCFLALRCFVSCTWWLLLCLCFPCSSKVRISSH